VRGAGWKAPPDHPDLDPPHEALQLAELLRESARLPETGKTYPEAFLRLLADAETEAKGLEKALRDSDQAAAADGTELEQRFQRVASSCVRCHVKYRDVRAGP